MSIRVGLAITFAVAPGAGAQAAAASWTNPGPLGTVSALEGPPPGVSVANASELAVVAAQLDRDPTTVGPTGGVSLTSLGRNLVPTSFPLDPAGQTPKVALDPSGNGVVVWARADGLYAAGGGTLWSAVSPARQILAIPPTRRVVRFDVKMAGAAFRRRAVVVAILDNAAPYAQGGATGAVSYVLLDGNTVAKTGRLATGLANLTLVDVATTAAGGAFAMWGTTPDGSGGKAWVARMTEAGAWVGTVAVAFRTPRELAVAADETGASVAAWIQAGPGPDRVLTRSRGATGRYGPATQVATGTIRDLDLGVDAAGSATMTWIKQVDTLNRLQIASRPPTARWSPVGVLAVTPDQLPGVALDVNARGDAAALWTTFKGDSSADHFARVRRSGGTFGARERTAPNGDGRNVGAPAVSIDAAGAVVAGLTLGGGNCCADLAASFRAAPPTPTVSALRVTRERLEPLDRIRVAFRLSRPGRVVLAIRAAPGRPARLVQIVAGRAGLNEVIIDDTAARLRPGTYTVSVGLTTGRGDPGVKTALLRVTA